MLIWASHMQMALQDNATNYDHWPSNVFHLPLRPKKSLLNFRFCLIARVKVIYGPNSAWDGRMKFVQQGDDWGFESEYEN